MRINSVFLFALLLAACGSSSDDSATSSPAPSVGSSEASAPTAAQTNYLDPLKQIGWIEKSKDAIKAKLRDPDSATWRDVKFYDGGGIPIACGEVNANNGFGGKAGFERFIAAGDAIAILESDMATRADMDQVWATYCR